jgi:hypothetical protein
MEELKENNVKKMEEEKRGQNFEVMANLKEAYTNL